MRNALVVDEKVLNDCMNEISCVLLQAYVRFEMVHGVQASIKGTVSQQALTVRPRKAPLFSSALGSIFQTSRPSMPSPL
jgi:signal recognition particle GTPase